MAYNNITCEILAELLKAQNAGQVMDILTRFGQECSAEDAEQIWQEIEHHKVDYKEEISFEELEAVSGGWDRDPKTEGCAATVEVGSWCGSNDLCLLWDVTYKHSSSGSKIKRIRRELPS